MLVCKYIDWNDLAATLAVKRSAGVAPEVNLRILLHAGDEACMQGVTRTDVLKNKILN